MNHGSSSTHASINQMQDIKLAKQRLVMSKMKLDILRKISAAYFRDGQMFGAQITDLLICLAVLIGQAEGRPMTATKLADYVGVPRPTVIRRLNLMSKRGMILRDAKGLYSISVDHLNTPELIQIAHENIRTVINSASILDDCQIENNDSKR